MLASLASLTLTEILRPKAAGEPVNSHVIPSKTEPAPDYDAMRRLASGEDQMQNKTYVGPIDQPTP